MFVHLVFLTFDISVIGNSGRTPWNHPNAPVMVPSKWEISCMFSINLSHLELWATSSAGEHDSKPFMCLFKLDAFLQSLSHPGQTCEVLPSLAVLLFWQLVLAITPECRSGLAQSPSAHALIQDGSEQNHIDILIHFNMGPGK